MNEPNLQNQRRLFFSFTIFCIIFIFLIIRLGYIQIYKGNEYGEMALSQQTRSIPIPAKRGDILDRNGVKLGFTMKSYTVWARPANVKNLDETVSKVSGILGVESEEIYDALNNKTGDLVKIAKKIDKDKAELIKQEELTGIWIGDDIKRVYPYDNFAAHVIGHTTEDGVGIAGIEQSYNQELEGESGKAVVNTDGHGRQLPFGNSQIYEPVEGYNLVLTIDEIIQHFMEKAVQKSLEEHNAREVLAIMMDVETGEILGMASKPDYNPNVPREHLNPEVALSMESMSDAEKANIWNEMWRNPNVSDLYEPGSPFKLITGAIALEENVVSFHSEFECKGFVLVYDTKLRCWSWRRPHGKQTFVEGVQNSCNPVFIELGNRLGVNTFYEYVDNFGFTDKTGIDLPAESRPLVRTPEKIGPVELATMTYGHGLSITPLQMTAALGALANDGRLMVPYVVREIRDDEGNIIVGNKPKFVRQVISEKTSQEMLQVMESVVTDGSGLNAYIPGYRIGGKTGTTNKIINGIYSEERVFSSFAAVAPINEPKIALLIVVDEPKLEHYGSLVAAPVARDILENTLRYLEIEPDFGDEAFKLLVPELIGLDLDKAKKIALNNSLQFSVLPETVEGYKYKVVDQYPKGGSYVMEGTSLILHVELRNDLGIEN